MLMKTILNGLKRALLPSGNSGSIVKDLLTLKDNDNSVNEALAYAIAWVVRLVIAVGVYKASVWLGITPAELMELIKSFEEVGGN